MMRNTIRFFSNKSIDAINKQRLNDSVNGLQRVTLIPGDGIGPEISNSLVRIFEKARVPIVWDVVDMSTNIEQQRKCIDSIKQNKVGLKGPLATPIGKGHVSLNITLRKELNLWVNVRPCKSLKGYPTAYNNVDLVTVRENTEGLYRGIEHKLLPGVMQTIRMITRPACDRVAKHAFLFADANERKKVTAVHKGSIMKKADGIFIQSCREISEKFPHIEYEEQSIDNLARLLVSTPEKLDVMVMENLFGDIISDLCAGLIGGLGLTPSGNIGDDVAVFEAVHGTAPDIQGQNKANPTALLLSGVMMLRHMGLNDYALNIEQSLHNVLCQKEYLTGDLGGKASCTDFTDAIIRNLN